MDNNDLIIYKNSDGNIIVDAIFKDETLWLTQKGMSKVFDLTNMFLVFAEGEAKERHVMTMQDWISATDDLLKFRRKEFLDNSGNISHKQAVEKAVKNIELYKIKNMYLLWMNFIINIWKKIKMIVIERKNYETLYYSKI